MPKSGEHRVNTIDSFFRVRPSSQNIREGENVSFLEDGKLIKQEKRNGVVYEQVYVEQGQAQAAARVGTSTGDITNVVISGSSSGSGDVTGITAGTGLTGGGSSGNINLNVVGGTGITANADDIAIDSTVTTLTGTQTLTNKTLTGPKTTGDVLNSGNVSGNTYKYYNSASNTLGNTAFTVSQSGEVNFAATVELTNSVFAADVNDGPVVNFYNNRTNPDQVVKLGTIQFSAPVSGSPGDISRLTAAYIEAKAHSTFSSSNNQTNLIFYTANNAIADETLRLNYNGSTTFNNAFTFPTADGSANQFLRTNGSGTVSWSNTLVSPTFTGTAQGANLTLTGDLTVGGTTTTLNAENLQVKDKNIVLNYLDGDSSSTADGAGITIQDAVNSSTDATMLWDATNDEFDFSHTVTAPDFTGDLTGNASTATTATTATTLATARNFSLTGDVTAGAVSFDGSGNVALSTTIAADSVALGTDTTGNYVGTITTGSGVSTSGASTGEGIAHNLSINAAQTAITSIYNSSLEIGSASDGQIIDFGTTDEIRLGSATQTSVKIKTDPLGSAQDEVIIGAGTANVDFIVEDDAGVAVLTVDSGTSKTTLHSLDVTNNVGLGDVTADNVASNSFHYNNGGSLGEEAFTIGASGGVNFTQAIALSNADFSANSSDGAVLNLKTTLTNADAVDVLGRINFSAPVSGSPGDYSRLTAASIVAQKSATFSSTSNQTDMIFQLGVSETATEKFRILSDGKIKIGNSYTLPSSDGSANQILKTNGSGTVSFADESTGISFNGSTTNGLLTYGSSTTADVETDLVYTATGLGIGVTTPGALLDVNGTGYIRTAVFSDAFKPYSGTLATYGSSSSTDHYFVGDVGIGVVSPSRTLDVDGIIRSNTAGGRFEAISGTSGTGYYIFGDSGDLDIGWISYEHANNAMAFKVNASERMRIDSSGNVGIGNTSPDATLHIGDNSSSFTLGTTSGNSIDLLKLETQSTNANQLIFSSERVADGNTWTTTRERIYRRVDASNMGYIQFGSSFSASLADMISFGEVGVGDYMGITGDGKVGISTNSPTAKLQIGGGTDGKLFYTDGLYNDVTFNGGSGGTNGVWEFVNSGTWGQTRMYVQDANNVAGRLTFDFRGNAGSNKILAGDSTGKVGIGITAPDTLLHIKNTGSGGTTTLKLEDNAREMYLGRDSIKVTALDGSTSAQLYINSNVTFSGSVTGITTLNASSSLTTGYGVAFTNGNTNFLQYNNSGEDVLYLRDTTNGAMLLTYGTDRTTIHKNTRHSDQVEFEDTNAVINRVSNDLEIRTYGGYDINLMPSGNVGIGTTSPDSKLQVEYTTTSNGSAAIAEFGTSGSGSIAGSAHQVIVGGPSVSDYTGIQIFSDTTTGKGVLSFADGRGANDNWRGVIQYDHSANDMEFWTDAAERMKIDSAGRLMIGDTSVHYSGVDLQVGSTSDGQNGIQIQTSTTGYGYVLFGDGTGASAYRGQISYKHGDDYMNFFTAGAERLRIVSGGDAHFDQDVIAFSTTPSDRRLKTNIKDIEYGLDTIMKLTPKEYDWKKDDRHDIGFIAQEVEEVIPEIVKDKKHFDKEIKTLDYEKLTAVLIKAVQEQQEQINELKEKLNG